MPIDRPLNRFCLRVLAALPACFILAACGSSSLTIAPPPPQASYAERTAALRSIEAPRRVTRRSSATTARAYESGTAVNEVALTTSPRVGTPEWEREQAQNEREEKRVQSVIQSICRGC